MRGIKLVSLLAILVLFIPFCTSIPTSYDTAQIPEDGKNLRVGIGGQIGEVRYPVSSIHYRGFRGDLQVGYGVGRFFENGANVGIAAGNYEYEYYEYNKYKWENTIIQADIYPYIKVGIPTDPVRLSLKYSLGGGIMVVKYGTIIGTIIIRKPYFYFAGTYADILLGIGNPEFLTMGLRVIGVDPDYFPFIGYPPLMLILSSHLYGFTLSFMFGYYDYRYGYYKFSREGWSRNVYFGIGKYF